MLEPKRCTLYFDYLFERNLLSNITITWPSTEQTMTNAPQSFQVPYAHVASLWAWKPPSVAGTPRAQWFPSMARSHGLCSWPCSLKANKNLRFSKATPGKPKWLHERERERSALDSSATMCHAQLMFLILLRRHSSGVSWKEFKKDVSMFQNSLAYPRTLMSCLWSKVYRRILWCQTMLSSIAFATDVHSRNRPSGTSADLPLVCLNETPGIPSIK